MAHIVPNPPHKDYRSKELRRFNIGLALGDARVIVWGLPKGATDDEFMIGRTNTGTDGYSHLLSKIVHGPAFDLHTFTVKGLKHGDEIALFRDTAFGTRRDSNWVRHSTNTAVVDRVYADTSAPLEAKGKLPTYANNSNIRFYSFGSLQRKKPLSQASWQKGVTDTLDKLWANPLGQKVVKLITAPLTIYPYLPMDGNADAEIHFTAQDSEIATDPGDSADETLFHELIHVIENNAGQYKDGHGFAFDGTDFLTVNATNVYSCLLGAALRKDYGDEPMPRDYFVAPLKHFRDFIGNYKLAKARVPQLYQVLATSSPLWNPFQFDPNNPPP